MPELPDVTVYVDALHRFIVGRRLEEVQVRSPFVVRTVVPDIGDARGREVLGVRRMAKRIVWQLEGDLWFVFHLMIAGRFHWRKTGTQPRAKTDLAAFHFAHGVLMLTEASAKKRAAQYVVAGEAQLREHDPGGLEVLECDELAFRNALQRENHTLKRALTDPRLFSGIGNAYSDEILHAARLSPLKWTSRLTSDEVTRLFRATQITLRGWIDRLLAETADGFPEKVTAFREGMAVHGRFGQPCPICGSPVQRIVFAENETNYCARCQTEGRLLADRSLSRLLKSDWPDRLADE
jgi:formamidopyrimidine-DNA glycosylase